MQTRHPLAAAIALALSATAGPAAAVYTLELSDLTNALYVPSNVDAWIAYEETCPNTVNGSGNASCNAGLKPSASSAANTDPNADQVLFFWGQQTGATSANNTLIDITNTGPSATANISSVRLLSLKAEDGSLPALGATGGPVFGTVPFGPDVQGAGMFNTYGRDDITSFAWNADSALNVDVSGDGPVTGSSDIALFPDNTARWDFDSGSGQPVDLPVAASATFGSAAALGAGGTMTMRLYAPDIPIPTSGSDPTSYLSDIIIQFNPTAGANDQQAGMIVDGLPDGASTPAYQRSGDTLTGTTRVRAGAEGAFSGTVEVFNQGGASSSIDGTAISVTTSGSGMATSGGSLAGNSVALAIAERSGEQGFTFAPAGALTDPTDTDGTDGTLSIGFDNATAELTIQNVGPLLGVSADSGATNLPYDQSQLIDLGTIDLASESTATQSLLISNLFGTDYGDLTSLTIANVGLTGAGAAAFSFNDTDFGNKVVLANGRDLSGGGTLAALDLLFDPSNVVGTYSATLYFLTDMNNPFGSTAGEAACQNATIGVTDGCLRFTVTADAIRTGGGAPAPASILLIGSGLLGLAGLRARRRGKGA